MDEFNGSRMGAAAEISNEIIFSFLKKLGRHWKFIVIMSVVLVLAGFGVAKLTYEPTYTSKITFSASNKEQTIVGAAQSSSDLNASATLAKTFGYVLKTDDLLSKVASSCGYKNISARDVYAWTSVTAVEDTPIIKVNIRTPDAKLSQGIANAYLNNYTDVVKLAFPNTALTVIDAPKQAARADKTNIFVKLPTLFLFIGLAAYVVFLYLNLLLQDTVKSSDDIRNKYGKKVLASIATVKRTGENKKNQKAILISEERSGFQFIETFKMLRTRIENIKKTKGYKTFVVTSALENEGKTMTSINLALALAENGNNVLLIDADLRKPAVGLALGIDTKGDKGLPGIINGERKITESIKYSDKYRLYLLMIETPIENPSEVLSRKETREFIENEKKEFDYIIIDTAPGIVTDSAIISSYTDASILVVRSDYAPSKRLNHTIDALSTSGSGELIGVVYNNGRKRNKKSNSSGYGYGYGSYGHYGYGKKSYGYGYGKSKRK